MRQVALVTGASSGLGEQLAWLAARHGHDVVLVARNTARLEALATQLRGEKVEVHVFSADLSLPEAPQQLFDRVREKGLDVEFLINNAGFGSNGPFLDLPLSGEGDMVEVNCNALLKLTHLFARPMQARGHGRILNIASTAGFQPGPFMATYYATKAFVVSFSEALAHELKPRGVSVTCFCPGATATEFAAGNREGRRGRAGGLRRDDGGGGALGARGSQLAGGPVGAVLSAVRGASHRRGAELPAGAMRGPRPSWVA